MSGMITIFDMTFHARHSVTLTKGSLWTSEWSPTTEYISLGISGCGLLMETKTNKLTRIWTKKSDVFAQKFNSKVSKIIF